jgi:hypothetical protein
VFDRTALTEQLCNARSPLCSWETSVICDTCGKETDVVSRVVIDKGYNRANARPIYNCPECFERKNEERFHVLPPGETRPSDAAAPSSNPTPK